MAHHVALVGGISGGKDTFGDLLVDTFPGKGLVRSTSDVARRFIADNQLGEPTRDLTREVSTNLRKMYGPSYLLKRTLELVYLDSPELIVISGLYTTQEADHFTEIGGLLVSVDTPDEVRRMRAGLRARAGESVEEFTRLHSNDMDGRTVGTDQNLADVIAMAEMTIDGSVPLDHIEERRSQAVSVLTRLGAL